jgi:hypothetical protein
MAPGRPQIAPSLRSLLTHLLKGLTAPAMASRLRLLHWFVVTVASVLALLLLWFGIAYGGLPRLWSHHEHKRIGLRDEIISYTAQDIPADPINLELIGPRDAIGCAFSKAGWKLADNVSVRSAIKIAASVVLQRPYPQAPVSSLFVNDRVQDMAFQQDQGRSADRRHHIRFWQVGPNDWLAAATFDRGVGVSLFTLQITHHIGSNVDQERDDAGKIIEASGGQLKGQFSSRIPPGVWHRNGGGDRYRTDGMIKTYALGSTCNA